MSIAVLKTKDIADLVGKKKWLMPELQRDLKWTPAAAALLLDSLVRDLSIRQIELWELPTGEKVRLRTTNNKPGSNVAGESALLVIDGQQRATVLSLLLSDQMPDWVTDDDRLALEIRDKVAYNVSTGKFDVKKITGKPHDDWIRVCELMRLSDEDLREVLKKTAPVTSTSADIDGYVARALSVRTALLYHHSITRGDPSHCPKCGEKL